MNKFLLVSIFIIFLLLASYNIGSFMVDYKYSKSSSISERIQVLIGEEVNETKKESLEQIKKDVMFLNEVCFE